MMEPPPPPGAPPLPPYVIYGTDAQVLQVSLESIDRLN